MIHGKSFFSIFAVFVLFGCSLDVVVFFILFQLISCHCVLFILFHFTAAGELVRNFTTNGSTRLKNNFNTNGSRCESWPPEKVGVVFI